MDTRTPSRSRSLKLALAAAVVAVAGGAGVTAWAQPGGPGPMMGHHGPMMGGGPGFMMGRGLDRMLDGVNATEQQRTQIRQIMQAAAADLRGQREASRGLRDEMATLFAQPTVDANAVEALRQKMLAQHDQASKRMTQAMLEASRVLTPEQRAQMAERMKQRREMFERHQRERQQLDKPRS